MGRHLLQVVKTHIIFNDESSGGLFTSHQELNFGSKNILESDV